MIYLWNDEDHFVLPSNLGEILSQNRICFKILIMSFWLNIFCVIPVTNDKNAISKETFYIKTTKFISLFSWAKDEVTSLFEFQFSFHCLSIRKHTVCVTKCSIREYVD